MGLRNICTDNDGKHEKNKDSMSVQQQEKEL